VFVCIFSSTSFFSFPVTSCRAAIGRDGTKIVANSGDDLFLWPVGAGGWEKLPGAACRVSCGDAHNIIVTNRTGGVYRHVPGSWVALPNSPSAPFAHVQISPSGKIAGVTTADEVFAFHPVHNSWRRIPGAVRHIAITDEFIIGSNAGTDIYQLRF
jgi:hypothetical protein